MNGIRGSIINLYNSATFYKDKLGKWIAFHIQNEERKIIIVTLYRIPASIGGGTSTSLA